MRGMTPVPGPKYASRLGSVLDAQKVPVDPKWQENRLTGGPNIGYRAPIRASQIEGWAEEEWERMTADGWNAICHECHEGVSRLGFCPCGWASPGDRLRARVLGSPLPFRMLEGEAPREASRKVVPLKSSDDGWPTEWPEREPVLTAADLPDLGENPSPEEVAEYRRLFNILKALREEARK